MKLWTVQSIQWYEELQEKGTVYGDKNHVEIDFVRSYRWIMQKMTAQIGKPPHHDCFPIWAWFQYENAKKRKPDLRHTSLLPKGTRGVCIEFDKDEKEVLLSDFDLWHAVLNKHLISKNETEEFAFELELQQLDKQNDGQLNFVQLPARMQRKIINSWDNVLDLAFHSADYPYSQAEKSIQATFWSLSISEVTSVKYFIAR